MTEGFPQATAADMQPHTIYTNLTPRDPHDFLPPGPPQVKWTALVQRAIDAHNAVPEFADVRELADTKIRHQQRIQRLLMARAEGGFAQDEQSASVVDERAKLTRVEKELQRLEQLRSVRGQRWTVAKQLEARISDWVLREGVPGDCSLEVVADAPVGELLKKNESIADAVERLRHRLRELGADLHRVKSSPWPSSVAKAAAKAQIAALADAAAPDVDRAIEHNLPVSFPMTTLTAKVHNVDTAPAAVAFTQTTDALGLMCWLFRDQMVQKIHAALDEIADDKAALDEKTRAELEATILSDALLTERAEVACIWHAEAATGEVIDFRADTSPQAVLGFRLVNRPRASPPGTSSEHVITFVGGR